MSNDATGQPVFPVLGWDIGPLGEHDAIVIRAQCVNLETQAAQQTPFMALHREQVKQFVADITKALAKLDAVQATPGSGKLQ